MNTKNRRRRGAAIELAVIVMMIVVVLSGLLTSTAMSQAGKLKRSNEQLEQRMVLDRIGEDFCRQRSGYVLPEELAQEYHTPIISETVFILCPAGETEPVLTVELTPINGKYTVTRWSYGE